MILLLYPILDNLAQRNVAGLVSLDNFSGLFVEDQKMVVFVKDPVPDVRFFVVGKWKL